MVGSLSAAQQADYAEYGYLCPVDVLSAGEAASHRARLEALERDFSGLLPRSVPEYMRMSALLTNLYSCLYQNQCVYTFGCRAPSVHDYLNGIWDPTIQTNPLPAPALGPD